MKELIVRNGEGEWTVSVYNTYPSWTVELAQDGDVRRSVRYNNETQARVEGNIALHWPNQYVEHGIIKNWPDDALRSAGL